MSITAITRAFHGKTWKCHGQTFGPDYLIEVYRAIESGGKTLADRKWDRATGLLKRAGFIHFDRSSWTWKTGSGIKGPTVSHKV